MIGLNSNYVSSRDRLAPEAISHKLTLLLNDKTVMNIRCPFVFDVMPSTFEIIAFNPCELAKKIESTRDIYKRVYPLKLSELKSRARYGVTEKDIEELLSRLNSQKA